MNSQDYEQDRYDAMITRMNTVLRPAMVKLVADFMEGYEDDMVDQAYSQFYEYFLPDFEI